MFKLLEYYIKLNELGHPGYLKKDSIPSILCSNNELNVEVARIKDLVAQWKEKVSSCQQRYKWLLYFSFPKMLRLYHQIKSRDVNAIIHEVSFLVKIHGKDLQNSTQVRKSVMNYFYHL